MQHLLLVTLQAALAVAGSVRLAIDPSAIAFTLGLHVALGPVTKEKANPFFGEDKPWDVAWWNTYPTIAYDTSASKYKLWYNGCGDCGCAHGAKTCQVVTPFGPATPTNMSNNGMCPHLGYNFTSTAFGGPNIALTYYAESEDGISWVKPNLGIVDWKGSKENNIVLSTNTDPNRGVFMDTHETNASLRFKMFGDVGTVGSQTTGFKRSGVATLVSADGIRWGGLAMATTMDVAADTANNALYDPHLKKYIAFSRNHCTNSACNESGWGLRRETWSTSDTWSTNTWSKATESLHGEHGYEIYSMVPFRAPDWTPGLYLGIGSFFETTQSEGYVLCELCRSTDYGKTWDRLAPHKQIIPLGAKGAFDSHTCYAAPPILDPFDPKTTFLYYAGGNGPHSGGGVEHGRANYMARATAATDGLAGLKSTVDGVAGKLHTAPLPLAKSSLSLRVSSDAVVNVRMETVDGELLLSGVAFSSAGATTSSSSSSSSTVSSSSSSESVDVAWSGGHAAAEAMVERLVESYAAAGSVGHVVLAMEVSGMLFSFTF